MIDGIVPVEGFDVSDVQTIARGDGKLYTGQLINRFDKTVTEPSLAIFSMNRVGRPLGVATSKTTTDLPTRQQLELFESTDVADFGVGDVAYATARFPSTTMAR